jgi:hypothetical protein
MSITTGAGDKPSGTTDDRPTRESVVAAARAVQSHNHARALNATLDIRQTHLGWYRGGAP